MRLWTSPDTSPGDHSPGGRALARQITAFEAANPGVVVETRVKRASGVGGLLDFLRTATSAAPAVLPDVIALSREDLVMAASEGLVQPLTQYISPESLSDFYPLATAAVHSGDVLYGLPFSADAAVLVYRTEIYAAPPLTWADVISSTGVYLIPIGDPSGLATLQQYQALGGAITDASGKLALDVPVLEQVLGFYQAAAAAGVLPPGNGDFLDLAASWIAYREQRAALAVAPATLFLREHDRGGETAATLLPTRDGARLALGTAWSYALVTPDPVRRSLALGLMQWLTAPANVGEWTAAFGALPPRATALDTWADEDLEAFARQVMSAAILQPDEAARAALGPPLRQAAIDVVAGQASPQVAAQRAAVAVAGQSP